MAFSNELLDQLLAGCERPEDILGPQGLFAQLKKQAQPSAQLQAEQKCLLCGSRDELPAPSDRPKRSRPRQISESGSESLKSSALLLRRSPATFCYLALDVRQVLL